MVKSKQSPKFLVGYRYNVNQLPKEKQHHTTYNYKAKRKHILHSKRIIPTEKIVYLEARKHFKFNYLDFIHQKRKLRKGTSDINHATTFPSLPKQIVARQETFPYMKHFIIAIPSERWKNSKDKLDLLHTLYPKEYYPDLYEN